VCFPQVLHLDVLSSIALPGQFLLLRLRGQPGGLRSLSSTLILLHLESSNVVVTGRVQKVEQRLAKKNLIEEPNINVNWTICLVNSDTT
jgi:hypothetical protein